jgi:DHA2 family multidrug resistance protein-like MFS transporter
MDMTTPISNKAGRREWLGLAVLALPCLLYSMDLTVLNLALPRLSAELEPTGAQTLWIVDTYGFLLAGFLVTMGNLGDRIGRRRLLLMGAGAFGLASVFAAFSNSAGMLIVARGLLGIAGATLAPSTLSLIRNMFLDPKERAFAIGIWTTSFSVGAAIGPVLGGVLLQYFWWGSVFLLGVPVMFALFALGPRLLPEYRDPVTRPLDLPSAVLSLAAVLPAIYGMKVWAEDGATWLPALAIAGGLAFGALFVRRQRRLSDPLMDLSLFRVPAFSASLATYALTTAIVFGVYVFSAQYLQLVMGLSPLAAGLWTLPSALAVIAGSMLAPVAVRRIQPAWVMGGGLVLATVGFALLSQVGALGLAGLVVGSSLTYLGIGPVVTVGTDLIVGAAPPERAGAAAALSETSSELGGALGIAILGSLGAAIYRSAIARAGLTGVPADAEALALETLGKATAVAQSLPEAAASELLSAARTAFTMGMQVSAGVSAVVAAASAVVIIVMLRRSPVEAERTHVSDGQSVGDVRGATLRHGDFPSAAEVANAAAVTVSDLPRPVMSPDCH